MKRDTKKLLHKGHHRRMAKLQRACNINCFTLKPETNLALMMCLVFYLYVCLGGAFFLLLEGQAESSDESRRQFERLIKRLNYSYNDDQLMAIRNYCDEANLKERRKKPEHENLWNFLEATDFAYQITTGQGTVQTARILRTDAGKISYICFIFLGIPLAVLTLRATGQRLNMFLYSTIRFFNVRVFRRQLTPNIHVKALILNITLFLVTLTLGTTIYYFSQRWTLVDSLFYAISVTFTISNSAEKLVNNRLPINSIEDKLLRILFNFYSFCAFTVLSSAAWSAHLFTRHMRFKAQNQNHLKNGDARSQCPWVEVTRGQTNSPTSKSSKERDTDRESVC